MDRKLPFRNLRWPAAMNAAFFAAATGLALGPDAWLEWLSWGWTAGFVMVARMALFGAALVALGLLVLAVVESESTRRDGARRRR